jgi:Protein of unknown function (DUF1403)
MDNSPNQPLDQSLASIPTWARWTRFDAPFTDPAEAAYLTGAAFAILDVRARAELSPGREEMPGKGGRQAARALVPAGAWRSRLVLEAAAASVKIIRRGEDEAALRDSFFLRHGSADPGPAGRILQAWRGLDRSSPLDDEAALHVAELFGLRVDDTLKAAIAGVREIAGFKNPSKDSAKKAPTASPLAAAQAASLILTQRGDAELLALWLADAVIAVRLKWPRPVPLLARAILDRSLREDCRGRRPHPLDGNWPMACCAAYAIAAAQACELFDDLQHRSQKLLAVSARLRAKGASAVVEKLHDEDALSGSKSIANMSDRALRRLFDRLVALGAVRELTGRATFRLYGL